MLGQTNGLSSLLHSQEKIPLCEVPDNCVSGNQRCFKLSEKFSVYITA